MFDLALAAADVAVSTTQPMGDAIPPLWSVASLISLLTLAVLEIVLGIDNLAFIAIVSAKLPPEQRPKARMVGLALAALMRVGLLFVIAWVITLERIEIFSIPAFWDHSEDGQVEFTVKGLVLLLGGLFLIGKATYEIHDKLEGAEHGAGGKGKAAAAFGAVIVQILLLDLVFSIDSVLTAVGIADHLPVMVVAILLAVGVMIIFANPVSDFIHRHPTITVLALSFLILIGTMLVAEAFQAHIPKGYIYSAMAFAIVIEMLNMRLRGANKPVELNRPVDTAGHIDQTHG